MKRTKRASVAYSDAVGLLQDVLDAVPDDCYDSIAEAIHEFDTETYVLALPLSPFCVYLVLESNLSDKDSTQLKRHYSIISSPIQSSYVDSPTSFLKY